MRVVGYVRVSTDRQVEDGAGLEVQWRAVRAWCRAHGHRLVALVADEGVSGTLADRPALAEALALLREGTARGLVVHRLDRLARDLIVQEQLLAELWRMDTTVSSTSSAQDAYLSDDPADPSRRLIRQVLGAVSDYERAMVRLRSPRGAGTRPTPAATPMERRRSAIDLRAVVWCPGSRSSRRWPSSPRCARHISPPARRACA
ncbi:MAG: recombinase family protein [Actinomycetota bacterium]|jgi:DNA invertase Pin-like site-specific DNA recombinase|nr:recombinase family protein [Actinomycetota bacterium]